MSKKRKFSQLSKWIILGMILAAVVVAGKREYTYTPSQDSFFQVWLEAGKNQIQQNMLYSQSVMIGLLSDRQPVFFSQAEDLRYESRLPFLGAEYTLSTEEGVWEKFFQENQLFVQSPKEEEIVLNTPRPFVPAAAKTVQYQWENYKSLEELVKGFYTVDSTTSVDDELLNIGDLQNTDCTIDPQGAAPQILLYHTHSQETFIDSTPGEESDTIVGAGEVLASLLEEYGYTVLHHKGQYDVEKRDYAYSEALPAVEKLLKENPGIQVVIDLHRDAVRDDVKLVTDMEGRPTAKVMFFNGLGRTRQQGEISYLKNPYLKENLAFSFKMKAACDEYYPGFARNIYLRAYRYNMHVCPKTLLIELGAQTNTVEEIHNALYPLAHVLDMVLSGEA